MKNDQFLTLQCPLFPPPPVNFTIKKNIDNLQKSCSTLQTDHKPLQPVSDEEQRGKI